MRVALMMMAALLVASPALAQSPAPQTCDNTLACQTERVRDFKDYVDWMQSELAWCKATNRQLNSVINQRQQEVDAIKKQLEKSAPKAPEDKKAP